ncbi:hypothetical protein LV478_11630 [Komagataeibacter oboediens]|uniref:hypothetical protein n=1 Tax=Komagataeibacter oboediens TaxID=65958 RepID=UPI0023D9FB6E|nr:hypothetical protein [Komagataeibacter oboediens]WEQ51180.1 hypothetical protein LV478_11630 [Komagataeibacter oboediens]
MNTFQTEAYVFQTYKLEGKVGAHYPWPAGLVHCRSRQEAMMRLYQVKSGLTGDVGASVFRFYVGEDGAPRTETVEEVGQVAVVHA